MRSPLRLTRAVSLRRRVALLASAVVLLSAVVMAGAAYFVVSRSMYNDVDTQLVARADGLTALAKLGRLSEGPEALVAGTVFSTTISIALVEPNGHAIMVGEVPFGDPERDVANSTNPPGKLNQSLRTTGNHRVLARKLTDGSTLEPSEELENRELHSYLRDAVHLLPERHRIVVAGYFLEGRKSQELASHLGVTESRISQLRSEALEMKFTDLLTPECAHLGEVLTDPQVAGEIPLNYELEIVAKDGGRVALEVSTRPLFREGKAVSVQGIARDITARKKTEAQLKEAKEKLEAWVGELEQRTREMVLLNEMGDILRACLTTEEAYGAIVRVAQQIFPAKVGALYVISSSRDSVEAAAVWGDPELAEESFAPAECWALRRGRIHWVEHAGSGLVCRHVHHPAPAGYMCIPMMAQSEALGMLHLMQPDDVQMTESKQRLAVTMSEHIAMALSNLRLHETLRSQSIRDPLTGLFNRRFMEESLELELRRAARNQRPLGMIMIDLDHFKYFNDNFGHEAGDLLLKELGLLLRGNIRGEDIACRYGGEEFTLILPEGSRDVTRQRAEFFKEAIQRLDVHYRGIPLGRITASMGVAVFPDHGRSAQALVEAADKALYRSKNAGRDRVTMAE